LEIIMKKIALLIASVCLASSVFAADSSTGAKKALVAPTAVAPVATASAPVATTSVPKVLTTQQNKMVTCNKSATGMKGDERKAFMSNCLKKEPVASDPTSSVSAPIVLAPVASAPVQAASKTKTKQ
jgi:hypothetical protein